MVLKREVWANARPFTRIMQFCVELFALCFPALINKYPMVYPDSRSYFMGGLAAIEKVVSLLPHHATGEGGGAAIAETLQKARGVRSAFYSLFVYIPAVTVSLWLVVVLQAIIIAAVLRLVFRLVCPGRESWQATIFIVALSAFSTVSWVTSIVMPDMFTPVMALTTSVSMIYCYQLKPLTRWLVFFAIVGSFVMHITNLPIALGLLVVGVFLHRHLWSERERYLPTVQAIVVGILAMLVVGVVGFHQWSIAPQAPPFLLARSLEDGPAKLYLREHCPQIGLVMCNHLDKLDQDVTTFLWDLKVGVYSTVSPEEEAQIRAEDKRIYIAAALDHPWLQAKSMARNAFGQLILFSIHEYLIPSRVDYTATDMTLHMPEQAPWQTYVSIGEYLVVIGSLGFICVMWRRDKLSQPVKQLTVMVIATVVIEALVGAISEPAPRYAARVIWLIPMAAGLIWAASRRTDHGA